MNIEQITNPKVLQCLAIATTAHNGQFRRDGVTPYIEHCIAVANRVYHLGDEYVCVALLHDVLEDTNVVALDLLEAGIDKDIIVAVQVLTKLPNRSYDEYLQLVKMNDLARNVKIADMISNLADSPTKNQIRKYANGLLILN